MGSEMLVRCRLFPKMNIPSSRVFKNEARAGIQSHEHCSYAALAPHAPYLSQRNKATSSFKDMAKTFLAAANAFINNSPTEAGKSCGNFHCDNKRQQRGSCRLC